MNDDIFLEDARIDNVFEDLLTFERIHENVFTDEDVNSIKEVYDKSARGSRANFHGFKSLSLSKHHANLAAQSAGSETCKGVKDLIQQRMCLMIHLKSKSTDAQASYQIYGPFLDH
jgi:hypothetical protein